jgi:putative transposon-encoded protein
VGERVLGRTPRPTDNPPKDKLIIIPVYRTVRQVRIEDGRLALTDNVIGFFQKTVTRFGSGAKIDCPKEFLGRTVYVVVVEE